MRKKIISLFLVIALVLLGIGNVQAANTTASLRASSTTVKPGDTFTVTLSATCDDGINGIDTTITYDTQKLDFVSGSVPNSNWASLGTNQDISVICNSTEKITNADIYVLTFKVKETATIGTTATISTGDITLDSDAASNSLVTIEEKNTTITIANSTDNPTDPSQPDEPSNPVDPTQPDDPTDPSQTDNPTEQEQGGNTETTINPGNDSTTGTSTAGKSTDTTTAKSILPAAGSNAIKIIALLSISGLAIISYKKIKQLKEIK
ncbi:MAG: hypothetical protein IKF17_00265 [Clostridia bacterium]|nr:hypothetical protein [Clostridia bacterium]